MESGKETATLTTSPIDAPWKASEEEPQMTQGHVPKRVEDCNGKLPPHDGNAPCPSENPPTMDDLPLEESEEE
jgi:hypothetical protein